MGMFSVAWRLLSSTPHAVYDRNTSICHFEFLIRIMQYTLCLGEFLVKTKDYGWESQKLRCIPLYDNYCPILKPLHNA